MNLACAISIFYANLFADNFKALARSKFGPFLEVEEFRADAGSARISGRDKMIGALQRLSALHPQPLPEQMAAFGISGPLAHGFKRLCITHPPLEERIAALRSGR